MGASSSKSDKVDEAVRTLLAQPFPPGSKFDALIPEAGGSKEPVFVIAYGLPAAGKSTTVPRVLEKYFPDIAPPVSVSVDAIIESSEIYKAITLYLKKMRSFTKQRMQAVYAALRTPADLVTDYLFSRAIERRVSFLTETVGASDSSIVYLRRLIKDAKAAGFKVILLYPKLPIATIKRNLERRNRKSLRPIPIQVIDKMAKTSERNFAHLEPDADYTIVYGEDMQVLRRG